MSRTISCLIPHDPFYQMGGSSRIAFVALYPTQLCRDGGACRLYKEDDIELGVEGKLIVIASGTAEHCGRRSGRTY